MDNLLSLYLEDKTPNNKEFEVRFGTKEKSITKNNHDNVIKKLLSLGFQFDSQNPEVRLRINLDKKKIRCDIDGIDNISKYCKTNMLGKLNPKSFKFIDKRNIAVICCCCCCKKRKPIPDNGSIFDEEKLLSEDERKNGWYVESIDRHKMSYVKRKRYMRDKMDESDGMKHKKGEIFRTWEILRETGLHSYQLAQNPKYKGMIQGKMIQKTLSRKR